jgi:hypothetical protein
MNHSVEIRSYNLKPRSRDKFRRLFIEEALPMLVRWNIDVVAFGPSLHDQNSYYLIRRYDSLDHLQRSEEAFYGSPEWKKGPRQAILGCIKSYTTIVLALDDQTVQALRQQSMARSTSQ